MKIIFCCQNFLDAPLLKQLHTTLEHLAKKYEVGLIWPGLYTKNAGEIKPKQYLKIIYQPFPQSTNELSIDTQINVSHFIDLSNYSIALEVILNNLKVHPTAPFLELLDKIDGNTAGEEVSLIYLSPNFNISNAQREMEEICQGPQSTNTISF